MEKLISLLRTLIPKVLKSIHRTLWLGTLDTQASQGASLVDLIVGTVMNLLSWWFVLTRYLTPRLNRFVRLAFGENNVSLSQLKELERLDKLFAFIGGGILSLLVVFLIWPLILTSSKLLLCPHEIKRLRRTESLYLLLMPPSTVFYPLVLFSMIALLHYSNVPIVRPLFTPVLESEVLILTILLSGAAYFQYINYLCPFVARVKTAQWFRIISFVLLLFIGIALITL